FFWLFSEYWHSQGIGTSTVDPDDVKFRTKGLHFDFLPLDQHSFFLFLLFTTECLPQGTKDKSGRFKWNHSRQTIEVWHCQEKHKRYNKLNDRDEFCVDLLETIETPMDGPFYVMDGKDQWFFWTASGRIFAAPKREWRPPLCSSNSSPNWTTSRTRLARRRR